MKNNIKKEENKKLYKNWKLYASVLAALVIGAGTGLGIYYGINANHSEVIKIDLSTLDLKTTILSKKNMTEEDTFNAFLNVNKNFTDLKTNVEIQENSFQKPTYSTDGSIIIIAKENSKYTGTVTVTITKLAQTDLNTFGLNKVISGTENMTEDDAFKAFLTANSSWTNLSDFVEYSGFIAPTYTSNGSLIINAKANTAFTGNTTITINAIKQIDLNTLNLETTIAAEENVTQDEVFQAFLDKNVNILNKDLTRNQVELSNFQPAAITENGTLTITVKDENNKYTGSIEIGIIYILGDTNISDVIRYLSDNNLLNFNIPTGTPQGIGGSNLLAVLITKFRELMNGNYEYASNIKSIELYTYNQAPNQEELNTKGYVWHSPSNLSIWIAVIYKNQPQLTIKLDNINATITMV